MRVHIHAAPVCACLAFACFSLSVRVAYSLHVWQRIRLAGSLSLPNVVGRYFQSAWNYIELAPLGTKNHRLRDQLQGRSADVSAAFRCYFAVWTVLLVGTDNTKIHPNPSKSCIPSSSPVEDPCQLKCHELPGKDLIVLQFLIPDHWSLLGRIFLVPNQWGYRGWRRARSCHPHDHPRWLLHTHHHLCLQREVLATTRHRWDRWNFHRDWSLAMVDPAPTSWIWLRWDMSWTGQVSQVMIWHQTKPLVAPWQCCWGWCKLHHLECWHWLVMATRLLSYRRAETSILEVFSCLRRPRTSAEGEWAHSWTTICSTPLDQPESLSILWLRHMGTICAQTCQEVEIFWLCDWPGWSPHECRSAAGCFTILDGADDDGSLGDAAAPLSGLILASPSKTSPKPLTLVSTPSWQVRRLPLSNNFLDWFHADRRGSMVC